MTLIPAYGRDYKSKKEVQEAWEDNQDFKIVSMGGYMGCYVTRAELKGHESRVSIRYAKNRRVMSINV